MEGAVVGSLGVVHEVEGNLSNFVVGTLALQNSYFLLQNGLWLEALTNSLVALFVVMWLRSRLRELKTERPSEAASLGRTLHAYLLPTLNLLRYYLSILFVSVANGRLLIYISTGNSWRSTVPDQAAVVLIMFSTVFIVGLCQTGVYVLGYTQPSAPPSGQPEAAYAKTKSG